MSELQETLIKLRARRWKNVLSPECVKHKIQVSLERFSRNLLLLSVGNLYLSKKGPNGWYIGEYPTDSKYKSWEDTRLVDMTGYPEKQVFETFLEVLGRKYDPEAL